MLDSADAALIERTLKGDQEAFAGLVRRYQAGVWGATHRILGNSPDIEDAVQEIFLRAYASLDRFDRNYPFGPWILRIATNYCIDQIRRKKVRKTQLWSELREVDQQRLLKDFSSNDVEPQGMEITEEHSRIAKSLLAGLNPKIRTAFILREVEDREYNEIAKTLGTSEVAARVRVSRARSELQKKFQSYLADRQGKERKS
ncbi:MAG TPA: sigma-70 family RNA polymerase sigma factor [Acidobacteriota bacterium]|nr:sigma-70 family RNA polymerase sigma factor [Acidobacteriota bacterium]